MNKNPSAASADRPGAHVSPRCEGCGRGVTSTDILEARMSPQREGRGSDVANAGAGTLLRCPVCGGELAQDERGARCQAGHCFDRAREGYLNLLRTSKRGDGMGDPKASARSRRDFLDHGYYEPLRAALVEEVVDLAREKTGFAAPSRSTEAPLALLDICCGEGYYTSALGAIPGVDAYGFDLSKEMVRLAAKRGGASYFVANLKAIPVAGGSFDVATHLFAPFNEREFARVVRPGGTLLTVVPGARHLFGLKQAVYDTPYLNDERLPRTELFEHVETRRVSAEVELASSQDIEAVFQMTPYYYRTSPRDRAKLDGLQTLRTDLDFLIAVYRRL